MQLTQGLKRALSLQGRAVAVTCGERNFRWTELVDRVARLAGALRALGMAPGDRVAMLGDNSHRSIEFYYGPCWGGGVFLPLNPRLSEAEILAQLRDAEPMALILDPALAERAARFRTEVPSLRAVITAGAAALPGTLAYEELIAAGRPAEDAMRGGGDLAALFYTGGTTGRAKGVMLSHTNLVVNALDTLILARLDSPPVQLHAGPLCHLAAGGRVFTNTLAGGRHVMLARFRPAELLALVERERVTGMSLVPSMIGMLLAEPALATADLSSLRVINYGGSPMPEAILGRFMARLPHVAFGQSYGMTELSPIATHLSPADHRAGGPRLRSAGRAVTAVEVAVVDAADRPLPPGVPGEVVVRGPIVMQGYWRQPELSRETLRGGWMHTGDVGCLDEAGYLFIIDRKKDMIVSGGENVYSIEVEDAIHRHPAVAQCAVIAVPHETWGEAVHAVVVVRAGHALAAEEVIAHCRLHIAGFKCPRSVELRAEALPLSGVNKVNKALLRAPHWRGHARGVN
jgi:long-chain acyl-CoA synthetase